MAVLLTSARSVQTACGTFAEMTVNLNLECPEWPSFSTTYRSILAELTRCVEYHHLRIRKLKSLEGTAFGPPPRRSTFSI